MGVILVIRSFEVVIVVRHNSRVDGDLRRHDPDVTSQ